MYDTSLALVILTQVNTALETILRRFGPVNAVDDLTSSDAGMEKLDALCMQLIAIGESIKHLDRVTNGRLLPGYPQVEWKKVMGMRDVISHHYFDLDAETVFSVCQTHVPDMQGVVQRIISEIEDTNNV